MSFERSKREGKFGEWYAWEALNRMEGIKVVEDVREDKRMQNSDIDFMFQDCKSQWWFVEVKTDFKAHETGNIVYELTTSGNVGCLEKTKADFIFYFLAETEEAYIFKPSAIRSYISRTQPREVRMGDASTGYILDIRDLVANGVIRRCTLQAR